MSELIETVVLDSEELSAWIAQDRKLLAMLKVFHDMEADLVIGANTIVEVSHSRTNVPRLNWTLSRVKVEPVTEQAAKAAAELLKGPDCTATSTPSTPRWPRPRCASRNRSFYRRPTATA